MSDATSFWADGLGVNLPKPPTAVLTEAAAQLGKVTGGALEAAVERDLINDYGEGVSYDFLIKAPSLGFVYQPLYIIFPATSLYPVTITVGGKTEKVTDEETVRHRVAQILSSEQVTAAVKGLLSQIYSKGPFESAVEKLPE